jgi:hypothetical protein
MFQIPNSMFQIPKVQPLAEEVFSPSVQFSVPVGRTLQAASSEQLKTVAVIRDRWLGKSRLAGDKPRGFECL